jgi:hypothetical protein
VFERVETFHTLDRAATVIGIAYFNAQYFLRDTEENRENLRKTNFWQILEFGTSISAIH